MAELTSFGYRAGRSILHGLDARFKLFFLVAATLIGLKAGPWQMLWISAGLMGLLLNARLSPAAILRELRYFLLLLLAVFAARALATPGEAVLSIKFMTITRQGLADGAMVCWRLLLIVLLGLALTATTRAAEVRAAVVWIFKPIPLVPAKRLGTMMGLTMRFIPLILDQARETAEAQRSRGIENRKNPAYRLLKLGLPLIRRTFEDADRLVAAMESRCYRENRTGPVLTAARKDWIALVVVLCVGCLMIFP